MLIEFRVENHRSIREEQVLTLEAGRVGDSTDQRPRQVLGHAEGLLPVGVLYGANASGKSNILAALGFMRDAVIESQRAWSPDQGVPRDPFAWGSTRTLPSMFEVSFLVDSVRFQYGFTASDEEFLEEWLYAFPHTKRQVWFERDGASFKYGENLKGENKVIEEFTRPNALYLSSAVQLKHQQLQPIFSWFRQLQSFNLSSKRRFFFRAPNELLLARMFEEDDSDVQRPTLFPNEPSADPMLHRFRAMLRSADIGIVDVRVNKVESEEPGRPARTRFLLRHQSDSNDAWLPLEEESQGTRTLFRIALPILRAIQNGGVLLVDELESSLHPSLANEIVRQFNDPATNPKNAQLIFTTHDTNLLGNTIGAPALRRDQVWLTEKSHDGGTVLYPLTDYRPRKEENLERGYLQGRYGAIPFLGNFSLKGE